VISLVDIKLTMNLWVFRPGPVEQMTTEMLEAIGAFTLSVAGVAVALWYARRTGLIDIPNQRSSHSVPTPRGGGVALVCSVVLIAAYDLTRNEDGSKWEFFLLVAATVALAWVGWSDDRRSIRVGVRLGVHFVCAFAVALLVNAISPVPGFLNILWLGWWMFWAVASINIVNFMDGVDGMIASQGFVFGAYLLFLLAGTTFGGRYGLILAGACLGFLVWNWSPAKMFMGDVGSGPLGFFFVIGGALALGRAPVPLIFLPLFPLFLDALLTMVIRVRRGEKLTDAHRSHLYQRLANGGYGHARVASIYVVVEVLGAVLALSVRYAPAAYIAATVVVYMLLVVLGWKFLHGRFIEIGVSKPMHATELDR
jgi:Fuc2NAc and GlcNAc transferase